MTALPFDQEFRLASRISISEYHTIDRVMFERDILDAGQPVVLRGLARDWPVTQAALESRDALARYLKGLDVGQSVDAMLGSPEIKGRYFYNEAMRGFNFVNQKIPFATIIDKLIEIAEQEDPIGIYAGSAGAADLAPGFGIANTMPLIESDIMPRLWLGNASRVAAHYDIACNIACSVTGARRFTLFSPEQIGNLYIGPLEYTMAGQPASMVDFSNPDYDRFPKFREAEKAAIIVDLEPGDAVFIPSLWWHHVEAFGPFNLLVNYWWSAQGDGPAFESLALGLLGIRERPLSERAAWRAYFDHYVFGEDAAQAGAHLPEHARTVLGPASTSRARMMIQFVMQRLSQRL
jgi:Cupin-like domain